MNMKNMMICDTGIKIPAKSVHNHDLEKKLDTTHEWIHTRTGIEKRHIAEGETTYSMAYDAVKNMKFTNLRIIIVATSTPDIAFPSCASYVHEKLGLPSNVMCFDIHDACNGFVQATDIALQYLKDFDEPTEALVIGSETMSKLINWEDRSTAVLFGDGAGAMLLTNQYGEKLFSSSKSIGKSECLNTNNNSINMIGSEVFKQAVTSFTEDINNVIKHVGNVDWFVPHQANIRIIEKVLKNTNLSNEILFYNGTQYGNTSAASIPIALHASYNKLKPGDTVLLSAFGAGFRGNSICIRV